MAVAREDTGTNFKAQATSTTVDLTTLTVGTGANRCLICGLTFGTGTGSVSAITVNWDALGTPQAMTQVGTLVSSPNGVEQVAIFRLTNPTSGNKTLRASWTTTSDCVIGAVEFSGVNQTTPIKTADNVTATGASGTITVTVNSAAGDATFACDSDFGAAPVWNQTALWGDGTLPNTSGGANMALGGTSNVHTDSNVSTEQFAIMGIHIQQVQAAAFPGNHGEYLPQPILPSPTVTVYS